MHRLDVYGECRGTEQTRQGLKGGAHYVRLQNTGEIAMKRKDANQSEQALYQIKETIRDRQERR